MPTHLYLLRHAQAFNNVQPLTYIGAEEELKNPRLTDLGMSQAAAVCVKLNEIVFDTIYCSPLKRCCETLKLVCPHSVYLAVKVDDRLIEHPYGQHISNLRPAKSEISRTVPVAWDCSNVAELNPFYIKETADEYQIIRDFIAEILKKHPSENVLIVTHGLWISRFIEIYSGEKRYVANCECIEMAFVSENHIESGGILDNK
jgi:broad specificity phosphatase PhoE